MKISHLLLIGAAIYLFASKPTVPVSPVVIDPPMPDDGNPDDPIIIDDGGTPVDGTLPGGTDIYKPDATGNLVYSHTEVYNPDGTIDVYKAKGGLYTFFGTYTAEQVANYTPKGGLANGGGGSVSGPKKKTNLRHRTLV